MIERGLSGADAALQEALSRGLPPGSPRHLAVLFAGSPSRETLGALYAYEAELRRIVASESHEAAHARLQWWRSELDSLAGSRPSHPITRALLASLSDWRAEASLLHEALVAADLDLARFTYRTWSELEAYCFRAGGALQTLVAATLTGERPLSAKEREFARRLGSAIRQAEMLQRLPLDVARGQLYAPLDVLENLGIDPASLGRGEPGPLAGRFLDDWRARVREELLALPALLDNAVERGAQRHGLVLAALHARWLERPAAAMPPRRQRLDLEPLDRLWTAWRTAVRHG
jgi:phytoene synthase